MRKNIGLYWQVLLCHAPLQPKWSPASEFLYSSWQVQWIYSCPLLQAQVSYLIADQIHDHVLV